MTVDISFDARRNRWRHQSRRRDMAASLFHKDRELPQGPNRFRRIILGQQQGG